MSRFANNALLGGGVGVMAGKRHYYVFDGNPGYLSSYGYELRTIMQLSKMKLKAYKNTFLTSNKAAQVGDWLPTQPSTPLWLSSTLAVLHSGYQDTSPLWLPGQPSTLATRTALHSGYQDSPPLWLPGQPSTLATRTAFHSGYQDSPPLWLPGHLSTLALATRTAPHSGYQNSSPLWLPGQPSTLATRTALHSGYQDSSPLWLQHWYLLTWLKLTLYVLTIHCGSCASIESSFLASKSCSLCPWEGSCWSRWE